MSRRIRVCHMITELALGGAQENTLAVVEGLPADRYEVDLIAGQGGMLDSEVVRRLGSRCIFVPSMVRQINPPKDMHTLKVLQNIIRQREYDIVHTHSSKAGILGRWAAYNSHVPLIIHTAHGWGFHVNQNPIIRKSYVVCERFAASRCRVIVAVSDATRKHGLAEKIGREEQYVVIGEGIDRVKFTPSVDPRKIRERLGLDISRPLISMISCLKPQKSPMDFIHVAARVRRAVPGVMFVLAGDGVLRSTLQTEIRKHRLDDNVSLLGWRHDVPDLVCASDLTLLTSRWEGLPRVVLESISMGVPVVATAIDGTPEVIKNGVNGFLYEPGDVNGMAECIIRLTQNSGELSSLRQSTRNSWRDEYGILHMVQHIEKMYRENWDAGVTSPRR